MIRDWWRTRQNRRLIASLWSSDREVRTRSARLLAKRRDPRVLSEIVEILKTLDTGVHGSSLHNFDFAAQDLFREMGEFGVPFLRPLLNDTNDYARMAAANVLGDLGDKAFDAIRAAAMSDRKDVRRSAVWGLEHAARFHTPAFVLLQELAQHDASADVRTTAVYAISNLERDFPDRIPAEKGSERAPAEAAIVADPAADAALTTGKRLSGTRQQVSTAASKAGRAGKCRDCESVVTLTEATEVCLDWDGVDAYHFYCPQCYKGTGDPDYYTGQLLGSDGNAVIDQHAWQYER
jgi:hypothetical protein